MDHVCEAGDFGKQIVNIDPAYSPQVGLSIVEMADV